MPAARAGASVELADVAPGDTDEGPAAAAAEHGIKLEVVKLPEAKRGLALWPRRRVVKRSLGGAARLRRLARDDERFTETRAGRHDVTFSFRMLHKAAPLFGWSSSHARVVA